MDLGAGFAVLMLSYWLGDCVPCGLHVSRQECSGRWWLLPVLPGCAVLVAIPSSTKFHFTYIYKS